jgi:hypothetical protein
MSLIDVHYLGDDPDFIKSIEEYIRLKKLKVKFYSSLIDPMTVCMTESPAVVYVDFTSVGEITNYIKQVTFLKKIPKFKPILFVALLKDEDQLKDYDFIFTSGFQLCFIKGGESLSLFRDSLFIAVDERISYPNYAEAKNLFRKLKAGVCSTATEMNLNGLVIESDVDISHSQLFLNQRIFPEINEMEVLNSTESASRYAMTTSFEVKFPEEDPWGQEGRFSICTETVETWVDLHKEEFSHKKGNVSVIQSSFDGLLETFNIQRDTVLNSHFYETIEDAAIHLDKILPSLTFIEVDPDDSSVNSLHKIQYLIDCIKRHDNYRPILILLNMPSSSAAVQKLVNYSKIVCSPNKLDGHIIKIFIDLYLKKIVLDHDNYSHVFSSESKMRTLDVEIDIVLNKMTEHEVEFKCDEPLPMFSILHFYQPVEFYATLVPSFFERPETSDQSSKIALIHGVSEKKLEQVRKFVNALIVNPKLSFDLAKEPLPVPTEEIVTPAIEAILIPVTEVRRKDHNKKQRFKGKSKL